MWLKIVSSIGILCVSLAALSYTYQVYEERKEKKYLEGLCHLQSDYAKAIHPSEEKPKPGTWGEVRETLNNALTFQDCVRTLTSPKVPDIDTNRLETAIDKVADAISSR